MKVKKTLKFLISFGIIILLLLVGSLILKSILLNQLKKKIRSSFDYAQIDLSIFPPALILEEARTLSTSPFFSADRISVKISLRALLTREKPIDLFLERPVLKIYESSKEHDKKRTELKLDLPFSIKKGLIREGEFHFLGKINRYQAQGIKALFLQDGDRYTIKAEADKVNIFLPWAEEKIESKVTVRLKGQGKEIAIEKVVFQGPNGIIRAEGSLVDPFHPEFQLSTFYKIESSLVAELFNLPFSWEGKAEGKGTFTRSEGVLDFEGDFSSQRLVLNRVSMGKIRGKVDYNEGSGGRLEMTAQRGSRSPELLRMRFSKNRAWGSVQEFHLDPIMNFAALPYPISSPVWGNFDFKNNTLTVDGEFKDDLIQVEPDRYPLMGSAKFSWNKSGEISFNSEDISSSFARLSVMGEGKVGERIDMRLRGEVKDLKQARNFTSLILAKDFIFPEIRGKGQAELHIFGDFFDPRVVASFDFSPGGFDKLDAQSVQGDARIYNGNFFGRFDVNDPYLKGIISFYSSSEGYKAGIQVDRGTVEKIFPALYITLPFQGEASGEFEIVGDVEKIRIKGGFSSPSAIFAGQELKSLAGKIDWQPDDLTLSDLQCTLFQGELKGSLSTRVSTQEFDIDIHGKNIDLSSRSPYLKGMLSFDLKGKGVFAQDKASGPFVIQDLVIPPLQETEARGEVKASFTQEELNLEVKGNFLPGENEVDVSLNFPFKEESLSANIQGFYNNLDLILPWTGAEGRVNYLAEVKGTKDSPQIKGVIDFKGPVFPFPRFAQALRDYSGLIFVENGELSVRSAVAKLGGGDVQGYGVVIVGEEGVKKIDLKFEGKDMLLSPLERTRAYADGNLSLLKDPDRFLLDGEVVFRRVSWRREVYEKIVFSSSPYPISQRAPGFFDDLSLNLRLKADDNAWIENTLGRLRTRFDLRLTGNIYDPVVLGDIEIIDGDVYFQDRKFKVLQGLLSFFDTSTVEPYLNFRGETFIKNYRVNFSLNGFVNQLQPEFSSSPPLPPEDVLALLAMGESYKRTYSYDTTMELSTVSLFSLQLSEQATKGAEKLFIVDRFRITPFVLGSSAEMTARLTIGKRIARDFSILYSTNLTTQREEITRLEWDITGDISLIGTRDEEGRFSLDVKIHKRF